MPTIPIAANVFGTMGTICWTVQLAPQLWKSWREKSTEGLSEWLVLLWGLSGPFMGVYAVMRDLSIPLIVQPQFFGFLCLMSWGQCLYYGRRWSPAYCISAVLALIIFSVAFQAGLILGLRDSYDTDQAAKRAVQFCGIFSSVLISVALVPQYYEIYRLKEVVGISLIFMLIDMLGGVFNDLALVFKDPFDGIASISYTLVAVLDGIIILAAFILNPLARRRRSRDAENTVSLDPVVRAEESTSRPLTLIQSTRDEEVNQHTSNALE